MNEIQRLISAGLMALILHGLALSWQTRQEQVTLPNSLAVQRIAVSLGARLVVKKPSEPEKKQKIVKKEVVVPQQKLKLKQPFLPRPVAKAVVQSVAKPQPVLQQEIVSPSLAAEPMHEPEIIHAEIGGENVTVDNAANVNQQASPLYQINPPPTYPRLARRRCMEGVVLLAVLVDAHGRAKELKIFDSSGHSVLDKAASKAVRRWKFRPGTTATGLAQEMWVQVPVRFQLQDG